MPLNANNNYPPAGVLARSDRFSSLHDLSYGLQLGIFSSFPARRISIKRNEQKSFVTYKIKSSLHNAFLSIYQPQCTQTLFETVII